MCRICGRMVKCIFDSMPSRVASQVVKRAATQQPLQRRSHHISSRTLVRRALNISPRAASGSTLPHFLLPFRARQLHQAVTAQQSASSAAQFHNTQPEIPPSTLLTTTENTTTPETSSSASSSPTTSSSTGSTTLARPLVLSRSLQELLPKLHAQKPHYIVAHVHRFPYLLTEGDVLRLPFHMKGVSPGDVLRFNRASILGSRDYTLKAGTSNTESYDAKRTAEPNYLDERLFECRMRVIGLETGPMVDKEKKKRRNRHRKIVHSKHKYTVLRVMQIKIKSMDELTREKGTTLLLESQEVLGESTETS
ncbi:Large ribosomal subunit protein bL21m [Exophiala dermatitidis]